MEKVYAGDDEQEYRSEVTKVMDAFGKLSSLLYPISTMMKSQKKWTYAQCEAFDKLTEEYARLWVDFNRSDRSIDAMGKTPTVFNKMHNLRPHLCRFVKDNLMLGLCSEEALNLPTSVLKTLGSH